MQQLIEPIGTYEERRVTLARELLQELRDESKPGTAYERALNANPTDRLLSALERFLAQK